MNLPEILTLSFSTEHKLGTPSPECNKVLGSGYCLAMLIAEMENILMKCPLLTLSICLWMVFIQTSQPKATSVVQLWPLYAPTYFSAVICAINLAECPLHLVCVALPNPAPSSVPLQSWTWKVLYSSWSRFHPVVLLLIRASVPIVPRDWDLNDPTPSLKLLHPLL